MSSGEDGTTATRLTAQQAAALSISGVSVALSAGAGCGKTSVLTGRYLALLQPPFSLKVDQIVALTFTEKAARELRDRVRRACLDRYAASHDKGFWRRTLQALESARIGTFHGFCKEILQAHGEEVQVDPLFEILDESFATNLRDDAIAVCFRRWLSARNPDLISLSIDHGLNAIQEALAAILKNRPDLDFALWSSRSAQEVLSVWQRHLHESVLPPLLRELSLSYPGLLDVLRTHECTHAKGKVAVARVLALLPSLDDEPDPVSALDELQANAKVQGFGTAKNWPSPEVFATVRDNYTELRARIEKILEIARPDEGRSLPAAEACLAFARLANEAILQYSAMKADGNLLDFQDLQSHVRMLLRTNPNGVRERIQRSIAMLLVDEFQDTDPVQSEILQTLAGPDPTLGRLYLVGDTKQSIYRFRGAQPALFDTFRRQFPAEGQLNLSANFRSVPGILGFVNSLFAETFVGDEHLLRSGLPRIDEGAAATPCVGFLWVDSQLDADSRRKVEASAIANLVANRLEEGWWVRDRETSGTRLATAGDVVLLFRAVSDFPVYEAALAAAGLDYHVVGGSTYFAQQEVIDLINLLTTIEDPLDALALAGTLRGPFCGVSDEALFWLATGDLHDLRASFDQWETLAEVFSERDRAAVARASRLLSRWRSLKDHVTLASLLDRCLSESGFEAALMGEFLGERKRANVRKLVQLARRFDERGGYTLADFVTRLRSDLKNPPREEQAATTDEDGQSIRMMTIHQAKGLEFPIVIAPDLDRQPPPSSKLFAFHDDLGVLLRASGDGEDEKPSVCLGRALFDRIEKKEEEDEALRCLYVATTRARDVLILSSARDPSSPPRAPAMKLIAQRFDLMTGKPMVEVAPDCELPDVDVIDPDAIAKEPRRRTRFRPSLLVTSRRILGSREPDLERDRQIPPRSRFLDLAAPLGLQSPEARIHRLFLRICTGRGPGGSSIGARIERAAKSEGVWLNRGETARLVALLTAFQQSDLRTTLKQAEDCEIEREWSSPSSGETIGYRARIDLLARKSDGSRDAYQISPMPDRRSKAVSRVILQLALHGDIPADMGAIARGFLVSFEAEGWRLEPVEPCGERLLRGLIEDLINDG